MSQSQLIALDFDGVLCDSAGETAWTAWQAAGGIWRDDFDEQPDDAYFDNFRQIRPFLETGYQAILLARLLRDGRSAAVIAASPQRAMERVLETYSLSPQQLIALFGGTRDDLIAYNFEAWLKLHKFYEGVVATVNAWCRAGHRVIIVTTKEQRFAAALSREAGLDVLSGDIYGLEAGEKADVLDAELSKWDGPALFVEDRLKTLIKIRKDERLRRLRLYFAAWGYATPTDSSGAQVAKGIDLIQLEDFDSIVPKAE